MSNKPIISDLPLIALTHNNLSTKRMLHKDPQPIFFCRLSNSDSRGYNGNGHLLYSPQLSWGTQSDINIPGRGENGKAVSMFVARFLL